MDGRHIAPPLAVLFLVLLSTAARPSLAQTDSHHSRTAGGFTPTTVIVLVALVSAFVVLTLFSIYINRCAPNRPPPRRPSRHAAPPDHQAAAATGGGGGGGAVLHPERRARAGLDREAVVSFPTAVYGDVKARVAGPLECAVCLAAFEDRDELRVLPACCHVFHPDCIDPWLAGAVTCPLCRADLTVAAPHPPAASSGSEDAVREEETRDEEGLAAAAFTPESAMSFGAVRPHEFLYRRTQSAMDVPDRHTLRLPEHVMRELAAVRRHRRAASLAVYPVGVERTPGWLASFWRSVPWQRPSRTDSDAVDDHGGSTRVFPIAGAPSGRPSGSGAAADEKEKADHDAINQV